MKQNLLKLSLIISFLGILLLLFLSNLQPKLSAISQLQNSSLNSLIRIQGKIIQTKQIQPDFYILTIQDETGEIEVLLEKNFASNKTIEITGKLEEYKNKLQIQAERIQQNRRAIPTNRIGFAS